MSNEHLDFKPQENPRPISLPEEPAPSATPDDVQRYLVDFLCHISRNRTRSEAEALASQIKANGKRIYEISREEWKERLGWNGVFIYDRLRTSDYGFYRTGAIGHFFRILNDSLYSVASQAERLSGQAKLFHNSAYQSFTSSLRVRSSSTITYVKEELLSDHENFQKNSNFEIQSISQDCGKSGNSECRNQFSDHNIRARRSRARRSSSSDSAKIVESGSIS